MKITEKIMTVLLVGLLINASAMGDPPLGKGNPNKSNHGNGGRGSEIQGNTALNLEVALVTAGITAIAARNLAMNSGFQGYQPLPPGIAKNLAR